jgi:glutathione S-transferase
MKLFYSKTSPYSRKVRIAILEKGLADQVEHILCNPFDEAVELKALNPLGKIPTLVLDDGRVVYDSPVICEYLDTINNHGQLMPSDSDARLQVNIWQALADGIVDAAYNIVMEGRRDESERSASNVERWKASIHNAVDQVERQIETLPDRITMAQISLAAALGYLDFRLSYLEWRNGQSNTAAWYEVFAKRASMIATQPPA